MPDRRPKLVAAGLTLALAIGGVAFARPVPPGVPADQVEIAADAILCDCGCHPQSVHDCACGRAETMWAELAREVQSGGPGGSSLTGEQVIAKWVAERGQTILVSPAATGFNLVAWLGPLVLLVLAAAILFFVLRRLAERRIEMPATVPSTGVAVDPSTLERIRKDLEDRR